MNYVILILVLVIIGMGLWIWYLLRNKKEDERELTLVGKEKDEYAEMGKGLAEYNQKMQEKKNQMKAKILEMLKAKPKISNRDIAESLEIGRIQVIRYMDELEKEGKARQVGKSGRNVFYEEIK